VYPRRGPDDVEKRLVTKLEADAIEAAWAARYEGKIAAERAERRARLASMSKDDSGWSGLAYHVGVDLLPSPEAHRFLRESRRVYLLQTREVGFTLVRLSSAGGCPACKSVDGEVWNIDDALREMPIPHPRCTSGVGFCRCRWTAWREAWRGDL
jgi:hypothetical protein